MNDKVDKVRVNLDRTIDDSYDLHVGCDLFETMARDLKQARLGDRYVVVSDSTVMKLHGQRLAEVMRDVGLKVDRIAFPEGEASKSRKYKQYLEDRMLELGLSRDGCVIACGGGVTGDLAGFAAATYMRGLPVVQVPTTLLSMVDSSVGGKTGINVPEGKNLIGAFHQPQAVYVDVSTLETLPRRRMVEGMAEVVKAAVVSDRSFFAMLELRGEQVLEGDPKAQAQVIRRSLAIKAAVVEADEREEDYRRILNYGHTLGHAVEASSGYRLLHGEAVSLGMALEGELAVREEIMDSGELERQNTLLKRLGLPINAAVALRALLGQLASPNEILEYTHKDKKARGGVVEYSLPIKIGRMKKRKKRYGVAIDDRVAIQFLRRVFR